ncbi:putative coat protein [Phomopsis longicolla circular virus 1]|uniref:putative coat protein n=1 Tax=Phomopsis longicolla circular virus 1 TaxID=1808960 RepID=UPI0009A10105|nr:putative coat protein [Phomopsis longicolla circular virus 1]AMN09329.1 putative coat protein [Phomopsis longicolla circular virus 1]
MVFGRRGGYRRHFYNSRPYYRFASAVNSVGQEKKNKTVSLAGPGSASAHCEMHAGDPDSGFVLPATEVCRSGDRSSGREVHLRGAKLSFEICVSRTCSVRVLSVVLDTDRNWFNVTGDSVGLKNTQNGGFGPLSGTGHGIVHFLDVNNGVFSSEDLRPWFFRSVSKRTKGRILLDQVQHFTVGDRFQFRPVSAWLDLHGKVTYQQTSDIVDRDGVCTRGIDEKPYNVYFIVLVHVPSFSTEQVVRQSIGMPDVGRMDVDDPRVPKRERGIPGYGSRPSTAESEASTIILDRKGVAVPAIEMRNISSALYWRE